MQLDPTNEHAVDADDYDRSVEHSPTGDLVRFETTSHGKPPLPQSSKQPVDFGSSEDLDQDEEIHGEQVLMNDNRLLSDEFNKTVRISNGGMRSSATRSHSGSGQIKLADSDRAQNSLYSPVISR